MAAVAHDFEVEGLVNAWCRRSDKCLNSKDPREREMQGAITMNEP